MLVAPVSSIATRRWRCFAIVLVCALGVSAQVFATAPPEFRVRTNTMAYSPDSSLVAFAFLDEGPVRTVNARTGEVVAVFPVDEPVVCIAFSADGHYLAAGTERSYEPREGSVFLWNVATGALVSRATTPASLLFVVINPEPLTVLLEDFNDIYLWIPADGTVVNTGQDRMEFNHRAKLIQESVAVNVDRSIVAVCQRIVGAPIEIRSVVSNELVVTLPVSGSVESLEFSSSGDLLTALVTGDTQLVRLWDTGDWRELDSVQLPGSVTEMRLSPDGTQIAANLSDDEIGIWEIGRREVLLSFQVRLTEESLFEASRTGDLDGVRDALARNPRIDMPVGRLWSTALMAAAQKGHSVIVRELIAAGADVDAQPWPKESPALGFAIAGGHAECVRILMDAGADVHRRSQSYLIFAAAGENVRILELLVQAGVDVNLTHAGQTALMYAAFNCRQANVELLLAAGANADLRTSRGETALDLAQGQYEFSLDNYDKNASKWDDESRSRWIQRLEDYQVIIERLLELSRP